MKIKMIKVVIKKPRENPYEVHIQNTLESLQACVDGLIEAFYLKNNGGLIEAFYLENAGGLIVICNEEGKLKNLPYNCTIQGENFVGTILFVGSKGDDFSNIPCDFQKFKEVFSGLWYPNRKEGDKK